MSFELECALADDLYPTAKQTVVETQLASISGLQRRLKIGYNRAARFIEAMQEEAIVSPPDYRGDRRVLVKELAALQANCGEAGGA